MSAAARRPAAFPHRYRWPPSALHRQSSLFLLVRRSGMATGANKQSTHRGYTCQRQAEPKGQQEQSGRNLPTPERRERRKQCGGRKGQQEDREPCAKCSPEPCKSHPRCENNTKPKDDEAKPEVGARPATRNQGSSKATINAGNPRFGWQCENAHSWILTKL